MGSRAQRTSSVGGATPGLEETVLTYNANGHVSSRRVRQGQQDVFGLMDVLHDELGRPRQWREGQAQYFANYRVGGSPRIVEITGPTGVVRRLERSADGRNQIESVSGLYVRTTALDDAARPETVTSVEGTAGRAFVTRFEYDTSLGHLIGVLDDPGQPRVGFENRYDGVPFATTVGPAAMGLRTQTPRSFAGESLGRSTASQVVTSVALDAHRRVQRVGPANTNGRQYTHGLADRLQQIVEADGAAWSFSGHDGRNRPTSITLPGGSITAGYDLKGRKLNQAVSFNGSSARNETFSYDALDRLRNATSPYAEITFEYSPVGVFEASALTAGNRSWNWRTQFFQDGSRFSLTYPSGEVVTDQRTPAGQLQSSRDGQNNTLLTVSSYAMADAPAEQVMGPVTRSDQYDDRRRLVSRRYSVSGAVVAELRYAYDAADREIARQYLHRGGRTDFFAYDQDSRLARAELASRPELTEATPAPWSVTPAVAGTWRAGTYQRELAYSQTHSDLVQSTATEQWPSEIIPSVATQLGQADAFGHLTDVDGATRARDPLGQTSTLPLEDGDATLVHDGLGRLLEVTRANGVTVRYGYRADGVRATRQILCPASPPTGPPCEARTDVLVYDGLRLLEVNTVAPVQALRARYYYADEEEIPYAADFLDESTSTLERYYLLTDRQGSVVGALDDQGTWVERVTYDPWGSPIIEPADLEPPSVAEISISSGILQVRFSEAVLPPPVEVASGSTDILTSLAPIGGGIRVIEPGAGDRQISGTWSYAELVPGAPRGSVLLFTPSETLIAGAQYALHVQQGGLLDAWSNASPDGARTFAWTDGVQYAGSQASTTTVPVLASLIGNEVLFQAHSYEPLLGLYHMRARVFDPRTGTFLEPDPAGFADAANLYAGFANDAVNHRDPTGANKVGGLAKLLGAGSKIDKALHGTKLAVRNAKAAFKARRAQRVAATKLRTHKSAHRADSSRPADSDAEVSVGTRGSKGGTSTAIAKYDRGLAAPVEIRFPARGLNPQQRTAFAQHLGEQEAELNALSLFRRGDLEFNLANYDSAYVDAARALGRQYLPGPAAGRHAAHALDSIAGGYPHKFVGFRDPLQSRIGALWRSRRSLIEPGRRHRLVPDFGD